MLCAIPTLAVADFATVTDVNDGFSGLVVHVRLPNGAVAEVSVEYHTRAHTVNVATVMHCGDESSVIPSSLSYHFPPCTSYPMTSAAPACVN